MSEMLLLRVEFRSSDGLWDGRPVSLALEAVSSLFCMV